MLNKVPGHIARASRAGQAERAVRSVDITAEVNDIMLLLQRNQFYFKVFMGEL